MLSVLPAMPPIAPPGELPPLPPAVPNVPPQPPPPSVAVVGLVKLVGHGPASAAGPFGKPRRLEASSAPVIVSESLAIRISRLGPFAVTTLPVGIVIDCAAITQASTAGVAVYAVHSVD